jgi:hypothetical protein
LPEKLRFSKLRAMTTAASEFLRCSLAIVVLPALATALFAQNPQPSQSSEKATTPPSVVQSGGVPAGQAKFRVIRSVSGSDGAQQNGSYVIRDPRTVFYIPQDHQVIVYFEWEGPPGLHHFEATWKGPGGKTTSISEFDYEAKQRRFGGYWNMALTDTTPTGLWTLQASVDGELTGAHTFQVIAGPGVVTAEPVRAPLTHAALYEKALISTVSIENRNTQGQMLNVGSGFFIGKGLVLTAFQVIEGASMLRLDLPGGKTVETKTVAAFNRRQDWAILQIPEVDAPAVTVAKPDSWVVGDQCFFLDATEQGSRIIVSTTIVGKANFGGAGGRINLAHEPSNIGQGTALLDQYGDAIGVTGGTLVPGASSLESVRSGVPVKLLMAGAVSESAMATPLSEISLPGPAVKSSTLEELAHTGQFVPPVVHRDDIMYGTMASEVRREKDGVLHAIHEKYEFARSDKTAALLLHIAPKKKEKGSAIVSIYSLDNKVVGQLPPAKFAVQFGNLLYLSQSFSIGNLPPGIYRLDVAMDGDPVWRTFFASQIRLVRIDPSPDFDSDIERLQRSS